MSQIQVDGLLHLLEGFTKKAYIGDGFTYTDDSLIGIDFDDYILENRRWSVGCASAQPAPFALCTAFRCGFR